MARTRSGKIYSSTGCPKCHLFHGNVDFDGMCSRCFLRENPAGAASVASLSLLRDQSSLQAYTKPLVVPSDNPIYKVLKFMMAKGAWADFIYGNKSSFLDALLNLGRAGFMGISAEQGAELYKIAEVGGEKPGLLAAIVDRESDWRIQHLICGLIVDWWNINPAGHGAIGYCYHARWGQLPRKDRPIAAASWFSDFHVKPTLCGELLEGGGVSVKVSSFKLTPRSGHGSRWQRLFRQY